MCRYLCLAAMVLTISLSAPSASSAEIDIAEYDVYFGDFNSDGQSDIYFHGKARFTLIHGDVAIPLMVPGPDGFALLYGNTVTSALSIDSAQLSGYTKAQQGSQYYSTDVNSDGIADVVVISPFYESAEFHFLGAHSGAQHAVDVVPVAASGVEYSSANLKVSPNPTTTGYATVEFSGARNAYSIQEKTGWSTWGTLTSGSGSSGTFSLNYKPNGIYYYQLLDCYIDYSSSSYTEDCRPTPAVRLIVLNSGTVPTVTLPDTSTTGSYRLQWNSVEGATSYRWKERKDGGVWSAASIVSASTTSVDISHTYNGTYEYIVQACIDSVCTPAPTSSFPLIEVAIPASDSSTPELGLTLDFPIGSSEPPSQTVFSGAYEYVSITNSGDPSVDNYVYVLMHYTETDPYGTEIWLAGTSYTLYDLEVGTHQFGMDYYDSNGNYMGSSSYRYEVEIQEAGPPADGYPETIVGKQPYSINVNGRGDAEVDLPLQLMPGIAGFQPSLSVGYNSSDSISRLEQSRPNSTLGYGWALNGISEIRRCVVGQSSSSSIQLTNSDSLCLDGMPLVLVDGTHISAGAVYRTKVHSNLLIEAYALSSGALSFKVTHPDGTVVKYEDSIRDGSSPSYQWSQTHATNADGNVIRYSYTTVADGTNAIAQILYSGAKIEFRYEHDRADTQTVAIGSASQTQKSLLTRVIVSMNDIRVREYHFLNETVSGKRRLKGIQQCGYDISGTERFCLKPTTFSWRDDGIILPVNMLLEGLVDSLGAEHIIEYGEVSSSGATASFSENPFSGGTSYTSDSQALTGSGALRYVVSKVRRDNGGSSYIDTNYAYQGYGRKSTNHWGFIGFRSQRITDSLGKNTYVQYRMDYPFYRSIASYRQYEGDLTSDLTSRTDFIYENTPVVMNADSGIFSDSPVVKRIVSSIVSDGVTLGAKYTTYDRAWTSQSHSAASGNAFTSSFLSAVTTTDKYYRDLTLNTPSSSTWGNYELSDFTVVGEEKMVESQTDFYNRTSGSDWLIGFAEDTSVTHTNRGYQATNNTTSYTRSTNFTPWGSTLRNQYVRHAPINGFTVGHDYDYDDYGNLIYHYTAGGIQNDSTKRYESFVENRYVGTITSSASNADYGFDLSKSGYDLRFGLPQETIDANNRKSSAEFDALGRNKKAIDEFGNVTTRYYERCSSANEWCYGMSGVAAYMMVEQTTGSPTVRKIFDTNNRLVRTSKQGFDGTFVREDSRYDAHGRLELVSLPYSAGQLPKWIDYDYDKINRVIKVTKPNTSTFDIDYASDASTKLALKTITETVKDSSGTATSVRTTTQEYTLLGHMVKTTQGVGSVNQVETTYDYNAYNQIDTVTVYSDGVAKSTTSYKYDAAGNVSEVTDSNSGTQRYIFHPHGKIRFHYQNNDTEVSEYLYDGYGRLRKKIDTYPDATETVTDWVWGARYAPAVNGHLF
jgi:hypothetical protein